MAIDLGPDGLTLGSTTVSDWADVGGGKLLQVQTVADSTDATFAGAYINENSITSSAGILLLTKTVTAQSSTSTFIVMSHPIIGEATNTDSGTMATLFVGSTFLTACSSGWFVFTHGYGLPPQTNPNILFAKWSGSHSAGSSYTFNVRVGNANNNTHSIRKNNLGSQATGFTSTAIPSTMVIYEVEA